MEKQERKHSNRWKKWAIAIGLIVLLIIGARLALTSNWLFDIVRDIAVEQANDHINGTIAIESIRGDLLRGFTINHLQVIDEQQEEVATVDSVSVNYRLFSLLFSPHQLDEIRMAGANFHVEQYEDSTWNFATLLKETEVPEAEEDTLYWSVDHIRISRLNVDVRSDILLPDGFLNIDDLHADLSLGIDETGFFGRLEDLAFNLQEARLPEPIDVYLAGSGTENRVTLESFVVNTGRSSIRANAEYREPGELENVISISPLSWRDLELYTEDLPLQQDLNIQLEAGGRLDDLRMKIFVQTDGLEQLELELGASASEEFTLRNIDLIIQNINLPLLTGIEESPVFESIHFFGSGNLLADEMGTSDWQGGFEFTGISYDIYQIDRFTSDFELQNGNFDLLADLTREGESVSLSASVENLFDDLPNWQTEITSNQMNLATWLQDAELDSDLNLNVNLSGSGFDTDNFTSTGRIAVSGNRFGDQEFSDLSFTGTITRNELSGSLFAQIQESILESEFTAVNWMDVPEYQFSAALREFNLTVIDGFDDFPTFINGTIRGEGRAIELENLFLIASAEFDSSFVNHEEIDTLDVDIRIENQFLSIDEGILQSPIADASFSLRQHVTDFTNRDNRLNFEANIKDLLPLAPLIGYEIESEGTLRGRLARNEQDILEFNSELNLENLVIDTLFSSEQVTGEMTAYILDDPEIDLWVELTAPYVYGTGVQDLQFNTYATIRDNETSGSLSLTLTNGDESSLSHSGEFRVDSTTTFLRTQALTFQTQLREFTLDNPFDLVYADDVLRVDTLSISTTDDEAHLTLWIPHLDSLRQQAGLDARNLNIGVLQQAILEESFVDGLLSGTVEVNRSPDELDVIATGLLSQFRYQQSEMDSLRFDAALADEWLNADFSGWHQGDLLAEGRLRIPFLPGDPITFDEEFFEREIEGNFSLAESDINYWLSFLPDGAPEDTDGIISFELELGGIAGSPELSSNFTITNGMFSGIRVDSVGMDISYLHDEAIAELTGAVIRDRNPIFSFDAQLPFHVDLKQGEVQFPEDDDQIFANIRTDNFDLGLFNSYVNQEQISQISGRLEGHIALSGTMSDIESSGEMQLSRGSMRVVQAGITLSEIASTVQLQQDLITIQHFSIRSGPGRLRATGTVELDNLVPGNINVEVRANQFRAMNTPQYNALVNLGASLNGTLEEPVFAGNLSFLSGFVNLQNFGDQAVEAVTLEEEEEEEPFEFFDALAMELSVEFTRQFFIRNRQYLDMEIELGGQVDLLKRPNEDIQMFGTLEGVRGYATPLGRNFELDEATLSFSGPIDNPQLFIRTLYEPPQANGVRIFYVIEGTLEDPDFRFESEPELELQDIFSYTVFGRPFYELESWEQVVAGSGTGPSPADFALDVLLDRVEMLAAQRFGIDVVQIDNTRSGSDNTTSIKTGWYLNPRTFFAVTNEVGGSRPKTLFMLEYLLTNNLELIITQGDDTREGVDLRWKRDY